MDLDCGLNPHIHAPKTMILGIWVLGTYLKNLKYPNTI